MAELIGIKEAAADAQDDVPVSGFHNPLFSSSVAGAPKDERLFPTTKDEEANERRKSSSMVMRRHVKKDCRQDGTLVDNTKKRVDRSQKMASERQMVRVSSLEVPACVVVKSEDASDAGEVLQHCAFRMEAFRVHTKNKNQTVAAAGAPTPTTFMFVFHGGQPNQAALEVTHTPCPTPASKGQGGGEGEEPDPASQGEGRVTMTLGGNNVPHRPGEPYSCYIRQVGHVTFNPRKQARGYLYILSQEGRTLFTSLS